MLLQRVITAVVLLIIIIGALLISPLAFTAVAAIAIGCCFWEWLRICKWNIRTNDPPVNSRMLYR